MSAGRREYSYTPNLFASALRVSLMENAVGLHRASLLATSTSRTMEPAWSQARGAGQLSP